MIHTPPAPADVPAGSWDAAVLGPVREINEQVVDILCEAAAGGAAAPLPALVRAEFLPASPEARRRLAGCPYLLLDAGFGDRRRWLQPVGVRDEPCRLPSDAPVIDCGVRLARQVLLFGWHLARSNRLAARVALGMTCECAALIAALRLAELDAIAEEERRWVRLRWESRAELWGPVLRAARAERAADLPGLQMRGLQLLAADSGLLEA